MPVPVMDIWPVRMGVSHCVVGVAVRVPGRSGKTRMLVKVMGVVVAVAVNVRGGNVFVLV